MMNKMTSVLLKLEDPMFPEIMTNIVNMLMSTTHDITIYCSNYITF